VVIGVTGATGFVGGHTARYVAERGAPLRLIVRDPTRAPDFGAEVRAASSYGAGDEMRAALEGVDTLFLVPAEESADRIEQHRTAVDAAVAAGVGRIVYLSFVAAASDSTFTLGRDHVRRLTGREPLTLREIELG
jgi:NAD(P)H dehydrogenase (quinone)